MGLADWVTAAMGGTVVLAAPVAVLAGLVSFFSPCVVPLLPGYLSYATGLSASDLAAGRSSRRRILLGTSGFVLGIAAVFVVTGALAGGLGVLLLGRQRLVSVVAGVVAIVMGLVFAQVLPLFGTDRRPNWAPRMGIAFAPLLGFAFALGWTPCIGPALSVVLSLSLNEASALRGAVLALFYSLGLGIPFVVAGLAFSRVAGAASWVRGHQLAVMRTGGTVMVLVGVAMVAGWWDAWMSGLRLWAAQFGGVI